MPIGLLVFMWLIAGAAAADEFNAGAPLQGNIQLNVPGPGAEQSNAESSGPTNTNQPGIGGAYCHSRDAECGGTDRRCYDESYGSKSLVLPMGVSQQLYQETGGQIWIRCGVCRDKLICWPRPGYQQLIAQATNGQSGSPLQGQTQVSVPGMSDTMKNVVASCGVIYQQQGSFASRPSCRSESVIEWCKRFQKNNPTCVAIVAQTDPYANVKGWEHKVGPEGGLVLPAGGKEDGSGQSSGGAANPTNRPLTGGTKDFVGPELEGSIYFDDGTKLDVHVDPGWPLDHKINKDIKATKQNPNPAYKHAEGTVGVRSPKNQTDTPTYYIVIRSLIDKKGHQTLKDGKTKDGKTIEIPLTTVFRGY